MRHATGKRVQAVRFVLGSYDMAAHPLTVSRFAQ